jgi:multiple sugar transport system ATP-binding protein
MAEVVLDRVTKVYDNGFEAVTDVSLDIEDGEFIVMVGPSGCGKSTVLRMIAGLEEITEGELRIGDRVVNDLPPKDRDIAMVFQNYALYPHMTVGENMGFALKVAKVPKDEIERRVDDAARILELSEYLDKRPAQLSGGQRQRVAMGRAIVRNPKAFLMDEPLSNLDAKLRVQMRAEIAALQRNLGVTTFYVTHDQVEAMTMGDRVAVIKRGVLQQVDTPQNLYDHPDNLFVAGFIGSPAMNMMEGKLASSDGAVAAVLGGQTLALDQEVLARRPKLRDYDGQTIAVGIRPELMNDAALEPDRPEDQRLRARVELVEALGSDLVVHAVVDDARPVRTSQVEEAHDTEIEELHHESGVPVVARFNPRSRVKIADDVVIAVDTTGLQFFDLDTGLAIWD